MDTTVERLKVGTQVIIGSYGVNNVRRGLSLL